ncbi:radical SAM protein [Segetibacter sp. 3557_3]|uniref:radical SAM protein n=1 Tax=Segetibacter sp. 3557_3 TaxID=2547429 RepID=UPI001059084F|nr:radical SAM protein [Segetibacter sp. 3557_3]TDH21628.1 radical SAM protein [Segetibacter sp. 3557_3]
MWLNILLVGWFKYKRLAIAIKRMKSLAKMKDAYRGENKLIKYSLAGNRYYFSYNAPGWPSKSFNRYIQYQLAQFDLNKPVAIHTLIFGITKKCGYKCEHCFEWENLNKPETLTKEDITEVIASFRSLGATTVQVSGGEPLNRLADINAIVPKFKDVDFWIYTSGYQLTDEKAKQFKKAGVTGITVSLDHWTPSLHDTFRGKNGAFDWVEKAAVNTVNNGLVLCLSLCATNDFISDENLDGYIRLAKKLKASFVQILEPKAVGHYAGKGVLLSQENIALLEAFYKRVNFDPLYKHYPSVMYHGFYSRLLGCSGAGKDYLYVDMDGNVHDCPFCQRKVFNVLTDDIAANVENMKTGTCTFYN